MLGCAWTSCWQAAPSLSARGCACARLLHACCTCPGSNLDSERAIGRPATAAATAACRAPPFAAVPDERRGLAVRSPVCDIHSRLHALNTVGRPGGRCGRGERHRRAGVVCSGGSTGARLYRQHANSSCRHRRTRGRPGTCRLGRCSAAAQEAISSAAAATACGSSSGRATPLLTRQPLLARTDSHSSSSSSSDDPEAVLSPRGGGCSMHYRTGSSACAACCWLC